jgi:hypothetical protein
VQQQQPLRNRDLEEWKEMILDDFSPELRREYAVLHDARAAHDIGSFRFADYEIEGLPSWIVATLNPDPDSGSATIPGGFIKAETGEVIVPEGVAAVVLKKGKWHALAGASPIQSVLGTYSWSEPLEEEKHVLTPEDYYSPFAYGGMVVFRQIPVADDIKQLEPVNLLFPEWEKLMESAFTLSRRDSILYGNSIQITDAETLKQLVLHQNGLIATFALRELLRAPQTAPQDVYPFLETEDDRRRSIFTFAMIARSSSGKVSEFARAVETHLRTLRQLDQLRSIALGAFAAALFDGREPEVNSGARRVLIAAHQQFKTMGRTGEPAFQLLLIFKKMGINN